MEAPLIELVYFTGCPHVDAARAALRTALNAAGLPAQWRVGSNPPRHSGPATELRLSYRAFGWCGRDRSVGSQCRAGVPS